MFDCGKKDTCANYKKKCLECYVVSSAFNTPILNPYYTSKNHKEVVRCKSCKYHHYKKNEHGETIHFCSVLDIEVFEDFYCYYGKLKINYFK